MGRLFRCIAFALVLASTLAIAPGRAAEPVDLLLVLAADVSRSVDSQKFQLQREGYAAAMANPRVLNAIRSGRHGRIGVLFLEWSGFGSQKVVIDWMMIDGPKAAQAFGDRLTRVAAVLRRPDVNQWRYRCGCRRTCARAVRRRTAHDRRFRRRNEQCGP